MSEWRPIDTAPKDGTRILLWCELQQEAHVGWWRNESYESWDLVSPRVKHLTFHDHGYWDALVQNPTYWMPLPEPPK